MNRSTLVIVSFLTLFLSCGTKQDSSETIGRWILKYSQSEPLNIYGIVDDLPNQTEFIFKADNTVVINSPNSKTDWTLDYKIVRDTVVTLIVDYGTFGSDSTNMLFIGKKDFMPGYRIKKQSQDTLILISRYKKAFLELPEPNQFGTNTELLKDYEIILTRK